MLRRSHRPVPREEGLLVCQSHDGPEWLIPSKCLAAIQRQFKCLLISWADLDGALWIANEDGHGKRTFALKGDRMDVLGSLASIDDADSQGVLNGNGRADYGRPPEAQPFAAGDLDVAFAPLCLQALLVPRDSPGKPSSVNRDHEREPGNDVRDHLDSTINPALSWAIDALLSLETRPSG